MAKIIDVAQYILNKTGNISTWKLQKLVYYSQAWHLVWEEKPLFGERIEAWANGPVAPELYSKHRGLFSVSSIDGSDANRITDEEETTIDSVIDFYGKYNGQQLSDLTHAEKPWAKAREGLESQERSGKEITHESMAEYYGSL